MTLRELYFFCKKNASSDVNQCDIRDLILNEANMSLARSYFHWNQTVNFALGSFLIKFDRLNAQTPLARIIQKTWFYGKEFDLWDGVFIPRSETETLVAIAIQAINKTRQHQKKITVFEFGTGSGVISIILKMHFPHLDIFAVDISQMAIDNAQHNAHKYHVKINFLHGDWKILRNIGVKCDVFISNPPYIDITNEDFGLQLNTAQFDPVLALIAEDHGLFFYWLFFEHYKIICHEKFFACFEIGYDLKMVLTKLCFQYFGNNDFHFQSDLHQKWRYLIINH